MRYNHPFRQLLIFYFILSSFKGFLALYESNAPEPRQIFPKRIEELSQEQRQQLEDGIIIRSDGRLQAVLEEYLS